MILCDALAYGVEGKPDLLLDFATLTGAARIALGPDLPALFANRDDVAEQLLAAGRDTILDRWRPPLAPLPHLLLESAVADLANAGASLPPARSPRPCTWSASCRDGALAAPGRLRLERWRQSRAPPRRRSAGAARLFRVPAPTLRRGLTAHLITIACASTRRRCLVPSPRECAVQLIDYLRLMAQRRASDLFLSVGAPALKIEGETEPAAAAAAGRRECAGPGDRHRERTSAAGVRTDPGDESCAGAAGDRLLPCERVSPARRGRHRHPLPPAARSPAWPR